MNKSNPQPKDQLSPYSQHLQNRIQDNNMRLVGILQNLQEVNYKLLGESSNSPEEKDHKKEILEESFTELYSKKLTNQEWMIGEIEIIISKLRTFI